MRPRALLERPNDLVIDSAHQQIGHTHSSKIDAINDIIDPSRRQDPMRLCAGSRPGQTLAIFEGGTKRGLK
jgi:hypothetical protein